MHRTLLDECQWFHVGMNDVTSVNSTNVMTFNGHGLLRALSSFRNILILSVVIRAALILYSEWHDARSVVKYTDIDYRVFNDAARFILRPSPGNQAQGPLGERLGVGEYVPNSYTSFCDII